jgi:hypothetical protein
VNLPHVYDGDDVNSQDFLQRNKHCNANDSDSRSRSKTKTFLPEACPQFFLQEIFSREGLSVGLALVLACVRENNKIQHGRNNDFIGLVRAKN